MTVQDTTSTQPEMKKTLYYRYSFPNETAIPTEGILPGTAIILRVPLSDQQRNVQYMSSWPTKQALVTDSSSFDYQPSSDLKEKIRNLFIGAEEELFEDGMESDFSRKLLILVRRNRNEAIAILKDLIIGEQVSRIVAAETLRSLGDMPDEFLHNERRRFLEFCLLNSDSARIIDGASLGLASMDDPKAIPSIKLAIKRASIDDLRQDLELVLRQLEDTLLEEGRQ